MISAVGPMNYTQYSYPVQQGTSSKQETPQQKGMSTTQKTLIGLGALATIVVGGLLVKKHIDTNAIKSLIKKPQEFNQTYIDDFIGNWCSALNIKDGTKGKVTFIPKNKMLEFLSGTGEKGKFVGQSKKVCEQMSDNGICAFLKTSDKWYIKYLDPENLGKVRTREDGFKDLKDIFAEGKSFVRHFTT